jgi:UPF0755 protein
MDESNGNLKDGQFFELYGSKKFPINKIIISFLASFLFFYYFFISAPLNFVNGGSAYVFRINKGDTVKEVSLKLKKDRIIRSSLFFNVFMKVFYFNKNIKAGDYLFDDKQNLFSVVYRLLNGETKIPPIEIVFPEGTSSKEMAEILSSKITGFDKKSFLKLATPLEGELFPDTYLFSLETKNEEIVSIMHKNFISKIETLDLDIKKTGRTQKDIIKMASIVEEEGKNFLDKRMIAGILWKRLDIKMPLQVDAVFRYWNGKHSFTLSTEDLKEDSPYNTYTRIGLPPTPITNPGLESIKATINYRKSNYLYYLTGKDGKMYYATNHADHVSNKEKYLK